MSQNKSAGYVRTGRVRNGEEHGVMFLCEAALGQMFTLNADDGSLVQAPAGDDLMCHPKS